MTANKTKKKLYLFTISLTVATVLFGLSGCINHSVSSATKTYIQGVIQQTQYGRVKGYQANKGKTLIWKGVPYAASPSGMLRWKAPQDPKPWDGIFNATQSGEIAVQHAGGQVVGSEDSLNLDIYRPNSEAKNLPVLFYIHGGNNQGGSSAEINAQKFVVSANAVVVSINYRLGLLGFNNLPALRTGDAYEDSGNFTILDFAKALDWVGNNIASFGGNPDNITVSGFSAGGRDVMALLISPIVKGKFHKAISFSGGMTLADSNASTRLIAKAIAPLVVEDKIKKTEQEAQQWLLTDGKDVTDYLYSLSAPRLANLMIHAGIRMAAFPHLYNDGNVLPKEGYSAKHYNSVPLIMVTGSREFSIFTRYDKTFSAMSDESLISDPQLNKRYEFANQFGSKLYGLFNAQQSAQRMFSAYQAPIYTCDFDFSTDKDLVGDKMATLFGSFHGIWIPFLTGETTGFPSAFPNAFQSRGAQQLTAAFSQYIANFLWQGDPNSEGLVEWKPWTSATEGPTQLLLNADKERALIAMSNERLSYEDVLKQMEQETSISQQEKDELIHQVLNSRWFSRRLNEHFGITDEWVMVE